MWMYFFPTVVAVVRNHPATLMFMVFNLLLGWTLIGWLFTLIWAVKFYERRLPRKED